MQEFVFRSAGIIQYSTKSMAVFFFQKINFKKPITTDTTIYYTLRFFLKTMMFL